MFSTEQVLLEHTDITSIVGCRSINGGLGGKQCSPAWSINYEEFMTNILQVHRCTAWSYDEQYFKNRKTLKIKRAGKKDLCDFTQFVTDKNLWIFCQKLNMFQFNTIRQWIFTIWLELGPHHLHMNEMSVLKKITLHLPLRDPNLYWQELVCANRNFISWKTFYISCTQIYHQIIKMELKYLLKKLLVLNFKLILYYSVYCQ